jgi:carbon monoxide dehydrogenase subunit G
VDACARESEETMAEGSADIVLDAAPRAVWDKVGDFAGVGELFPAIESFRLEDDVRVLGMFGIEIRERLLSRDEEAMTITYSVIGGVPVTKHEATISVVPEGEGSKVTWAFDVEPDEMAALFADTYKQALEQLPGLLA